MKARRFLAACLAIFALGACQNLSKPGEAQVKDKEETLTEMTEAQKKEYADKLNSIDGVKGVVYTCSGSANIITVYGLDKNEKVVAVKISVGNIVSPPIVGKVENGRNVFRFFDGKIEWSTTARDGSELLLTKDGKLVLKGHKSLFLKNCEVNAKLTRDFTRSMGDKLERHVAPPAKDAGSDKAPAAAKDGAPASKPAVEKAAAKKSLAKKSKARRAKSGKAGRVKGKARSGKAARGGKSK